MLDKIKNRIELEITDYFLKLGKEYSLNEASGLLFKNIREFVSRRGKRVRPVLFVIGYLGYSNKAAPGLYRSAVSLELLHDFLLVHDDIIDKSATRRGKPSMHEMFNRGLSNYKNLKFNGQDLAIVTADVIYAMSVLSFLSVRENPERKEQALRKLGEAAMYTAIGEAVELLCGLKDIDKITKNDVYKIYDLKTAYYTFAYPLTIGATLAGANQKQIDNLFKFGVFLGRSFQIKDDILGMFYEQRETGKSNLTDLQEAKKTILIRQAYRNSSGKNKSAIKRILSKKNITKSDLLRMRKLVAESGALDYARKEISSFIKKAKSLNNSSSMHKKYKKLLDSYSQEILKL